MHLPCLDDSTVVGLAVLIFVASRPKMATDGRGWRPAVSSSDEEGGLRPAQNLAEA
jgi:hypothetical protein